MTALAPSFIVLILAAAAMALSLAVSAIGSLQTARAFADAARFREVYDAVESAQMAIERAEAGQRGFLLTGEESYLDPYRKAIRQLPGHMRNLEAAWAPVARDPLLLDALREDVRAKLAEMERTIVLYRSRGPAAARALVTGDEGNRLMIRIRESCGELRRLYASIASAAFEDARRTDARTMAFNAGSSVVILMALFGAGMSLNTSFRRQARLVGDLSENQARYRELAVHLQAIREDERTRLARELHDELGQSLTALKLDLAVAAKKLADSGAESSRLRLAAASALADEVIRSMRRISSELRPPMLDHIGLAAAIESHAVEFCGRAGLQTELHLGAALPALDGAARTALFRIVQESLHNVVKHAEATSVAIRLQADGRALTLEVADNGKGFDAAGLRNPKSFGVIGMQERARQIGAVLKVERGQQGGTAVRLRLPFA